jgi:hypothetical protein
MSTSYQVFIYIDVQAMMLPSFKSSHVLYLHRRLDRCIGIEICNLYNKHYSIVTLITLQETTHHSYTFHREHIHFYLVPME